MSTARHVYERHVAAFNAKDGGADPWSLDAELVAPGTELHGRGEVIDFLRVYWEAFPDARQEITRLVADGPIVSAEGRFAGTHSGPLRLPEGAFAPTGRRVEFRWSVTCEVRGEELISEHLYFDRLDLLTQLGLASPSSRST